MSAKCELYKLFQQLKKGCVGSFQMRAKPMNRSISKKDSFKAVPQLRKDQLCAVSTAHPTSSPRNLTSHRGNHQSLTLLENFPWLASPRFEPTARTSSGALFDAPFLEHLPTQHQLASKICCSSVRTNEPASDAQTTLHLTFDVKVWHSSHNKAPE